LHILSFIRLTMSRFLYPLFPYTTLFRSIGAFIPDLDREHLFIARKRWAQLQLHRALFHNFFFLGAMYLFNPYLAFGAFTHVMLEDRKSTRLNSSHQIISYAVFFWKKKIK